MQGGGKARRWDAHLVGALTVKTPAKARVRAGSWHAMWILWRVIRALHYEDRRQGWKVASRGQQECCMKETRLEPRLRSGVGL